MPKRIITGKVVSDKMMKTVTVAVQTLKPHDRYHKMVKHTNKFKAHDEENIAREGDIVRIEETAPISKSKTWRLLEVVERRQ
jgi:small subunit ribosomal protein S17